ATYLRRPDLGRRLDPKSRGRLGACPAAAIVLLFVIADGLSPTAVNAHAGALLRATLLRLGPSLRIGPAAIVEGGRVAIGDEIGGILGAALAAVLIGERPGLSAADSLGVYVTWQPARFNIGVAACDRHADGTGRLALIYEAPDGRVERFTFDDLKRLSNRCANALAGFGVKAGDRVGVLLPQRPETAIAHLAIYKLGAIAVPLFVQFGPEGLEHRLADSGAKVLITDGENLAKIPPTLPDLATILIVEGETRGHPLFWPILERARDAFAPADTAAEDPALIIYTSGTTGKPKGALHAHRVLLGHLPGVQLPHDFFPQPGDLYWTPADWAWIGGLLDVLLPSLYFGVPVLAHRARKFDPEEAFALIGRHGVRNAFLPPTALKMMRPVASPRQRFGLDLRSVASGGESLGEDILGWSREALGVAVNEFYGQTEANLLVGNCASLYP